MIASAYAFGARDFDTAAALDAMIKGATQPAAPAQSLLFGNAGYVERAGLAAYRALGYIPYEENVSGTLMIANGGLLWGSAATTLEYALADFAVHRHAGALGPPTRTPILLPRPGPTPEQRP